MKNILGNESIKFSWRSCVVSDDKWDGNTGIKEHLKALRENPFGGLDINEKRDKYDR